MNEQAPASPAATPARSWYVGAVLQGLVLGLLVFAAVIQLLALAGDLRVFRYQGF